MAIRNLRYEKDEILRKKSREVEVIDDKIQTLIDDMIDTMYKYNGVGLSAVQVGVLKRVVVIDIDDDNGVKVLINPQITKTNPISKFYVITDRCVSTPVTGDVNDAQRPANPDDYKSFKYDMGSWNTNYFRNALDDKNIYQYPNQPGVNEPIANGQTVTRYPNSDNNSLVYGKYFILVFNFIKNVPIKFEEIFINSEKY